MSKLQSLRFEVSDDRPCRDKAAREIVRQARKRALAYLTEAHDAKTGATANGLLLVIGAILGGAGAGLLLLRLLEGPARKKGEEL